MATCAGDRRLIVLQKKKVWRKGKMQQYKKRNIPNDIVIEILLRLPAKSLLRFRWTCKYWFDLITRDHDFIKTHLHRSTITNHDKFFSIISPTTILSISNRYGDPSKIFQCYLNYSNATSNKIGHVSSEVSIALPYKYPIDRYKILGSCNGLILLRQQPRSLYIWNPCTKEYRILPNPISMYGSGPNNYGFGYDQTTDDYKVIRNTHPDEVNAHPDDVQVYTLGTNTWRWIGPNPYSLPTCSKQTEGVFVNGALYWMDFLHKNIIRFDIGKEKFQHVSKTPNVSDHDEDWCNVKLQVFEGSLCVVLKIRDQQNYRAEMWVMNDYTINNNESLWTKLNTISNLHEFLFPIKPLRYTKNGEIIMLNAHKELALYDPKNKKDRTLCRTFAHPKHVVKEVYTESIVCLNSGTYTGQKRRKETKKKNKNKNSIFFSSRSKKATVDGIAVRGINDRGWNLKLEGGRGTRRFKI